MAPSPQERVIHIKDAIANIRTLRSQASDDRIKGDPILRAALERFFEIISEASRHVPTEWSIKYAHIPWKQIAGIGNVLRHAYDGVDVDALLNATTTDLDVLEQALDAFLATGSTSSE
ncbi:conserved hypothetical protein [Bosea sp. 62]|uniref:HepT-like ribonuclease domain-containing protein n=1 Tax=unclassified Bosea (in: a-proteobacteria) TaxID=2653178 RepID=UPI00125C6C69|nr:MULTISPECIES: HepT-like ribonuclease domain-containing protein [unclassified Bosea (in: a-proteobacteria)]CAD5290005.1 conserved hypothetical protein [Bosea sp. 7B]CAD5300207.1 conserved hypothetical protein [Bosea sp. 21B]CAD5300668.1 conserved hypothetical protein [Bosea sp. 46]VVT61909.1 conserved hypothetical protein [Bosea sp. EC-HK365B]VXB46153.1 conserved hypothetical protein [Bosea sp. 125]